MPHKCKCNSGTYVPLGHPYERQFKCSNCNRFRADKTIAPTVPTAIQYAKEARRLENMLQEEHVASNEMLTISIKQQVHKLRHRIATIANTCANLRCKENHFQIRDFRVDKRMELHKPKEQSKQPKAPPSPAKQSVAKQMVAKQKLAEVLAKPKVKEALAMIDSVTEEYDNAFNALTNPRRVAVAEGKYTAINKPKLEEKKIITKEIVKQFPITSNLTIQEMAKMIAEKDEAEPDSAFDIIGKGK